MKVDKAELLKRAQAVLEGNDRGDYRQPAAGIYPHQWLWDSCFDAIGQRHIDVGKAQATLRRLLQAQWLNGMLPNMIFRDEPAYLTHRAIWRSRANPLAPDRWATSGVTQPPLLAEAVVKVGEVLRPTERRQWYQQMYPGLVRYHEWLYRERDPEGGGLVVLVHPYESGLDNSPPWIEALAQERLPAWAQLALGLRLDSAINHFRNDTTETSSRERTSNREALQMLLLQRKLRCKAYNSSHILASRSPAVQDLAFNCILVRANKHLKHIAATIEEELPELLKQRLQTAPHALEKLWHAPTGQYYSRNYRTDELILTPTAATFLPLYAGVVPHDRGARLMKLLDNDQQYGSAHPVPSVPVSSGWFDPQRYWQGPTWVNLNWLIYQGLRQQGFPGRARSLRDSTLEMVAKRGFYEYFNPLNGRPLGAPDFTWTAALTIDLLQSK